MSDDDGDDEKIDVPTAMRNVLQQLQQEPQRYKLFGVYWWPVKEQLKAAGYGADQLYMLGNYKDHMTAELVPEMNLQDTLRAAFEEYIGLMPYFRTRTTGLKIRMASW
jgi:hypothetical protein